MITSSQGKPLSPIERAIAYHRLINQGFTIDEIAKKVKRSASDVRYHIQLAECEPQIKEMVKAYVLSASDAVALQKEHGSGAVEIAKQALTEAKSQGKNKAVLPKFNHKTVYTRLSSEVFNIIKILDENINNTNQEQLTELLQKTHAKLSQTMEIIKVDGWQ